MLHYERLPFDLLINLHDTGSMVLPCHGFTGRTSPLDDYSPNGPQATSYLLINDSRVVWA